jgi:hypothetical protein
MNSESQKATVIVPTSSHNVNILTKKIGLNIPNKELTDIHLSTIFQKLCSGVINIEEKNQLFISIIQNQLNSGTKFTNGIKHPSCMLHCSSCGGKGFQVILETHLMVDPCKGSKNALPCNGTGIKTSLCNRCGGLKLSEILKIKNNIVMGLASPDIISKYGHYAKINLDNVSPSFIEQNAQKTFRVIRSDEENEEYYYIPKVPCKTCNGTGRFIHDRKNIKCTHCGGLGHDVNNDKCQYCTNGRISNSPIKCPGCNGNGHLRKQLVTTNKVKSFIKCSRCEGVGTIPMNPTINIKTMSNDVKMALEKSGLLK